jgi:hypothetical protein
VALSAIFRQLLLVLLVSYSIALPRVLHADINSNLQLQTLNLPMNEVTMLEGKGIKRVLTTKSGVIEIVSQTQESIHIKGVHVGQTLLFVWDIEGQQSYRITITPTMLEIKQRAQREKESSVYYQSLKERMFVVSQEVWTELLRNGKDYPHLTEQTKIHDYDLDFKGALPIGQMTGKTFFEYRKNISLPTSVARLRNFQLRVDDLTIKPVQGSTLFLGSHHAHIHPFSLPYVRLEGVGLFSSWGGLKEGRVFDDKNIKRNPGESAISFVFGRERDGGDKDNSSGFINRKLKDKMLGVGFDHYLGEESVISFGTARRWSGANEGQGDWNYHAAYDLSLSDWKMKGALGFDDENNHATKLSGSWKKEAFLLWGNWSDINKNYLTVTGNVAGQGNLGFQFGIRAQPFKTPDDQSFNIDVETSMTRDRLSVNLDRPKAFNKETTGRLTWQSGNNLEWHGSASHGDLKATGFPYVYQSYQGSVRKAFDWDTDFISRFSANFTVGYDLYEKSANTIGFNAKRLQYGGGMDSTLFRDFFGSVAYRRVLLREMDPAVPPFDSDPMEWRYTLGYSHALWDWPVNFSLSVNHAKRGGVLGKTRQPFPTENNLGFDLNLTWELPKGGSVYLTGSANSIRPIGDAEETFELSVVTGLKMDWNTGFYIKGKVVIEGYFFEDTNSNRRWDKGEPGLAGRNIVINKKTRVITNQEGFYRASAVEGPVLIEADSGLDEGYFFTTSSRKKLEMLPGDRVRVDFAVSAQFQLKGRVYVDMNEDGAYDEGDFGFAGVRLLSDTGQSGTSRALGYYSMLNIPPGRRDISVDLQTIPEGYRTTTAIRKSLEAKAGEVLIHDIVFEAVRMVGGLIFKDDNGDGLFGDDEEPAKGVVIVFQGKDYRSNKKGKYIIRRAMPGPATLVVKPKSLPDGYIASTPERETEITHSPMVNEHINFPLVPITD